MLWIMEQPCCLQCQTKSLNRLICKTIRLILNFVTLGEWATLNFHPCIQLLKCSYFFYWILHRIMWKYSCTCTIFTKIFHLLTQILLWNACLHDVGMKIWRNAFILVIIAARVHVAHHFQCKYFIHFTCSW